MSCQLQICGIGQTSKKQTPVTSVMTTIALNACITITLLKDAVPTTILTIPIKSNISCH
uniref:Uncharacterized protein n=1 Tax=Arundo donax TaxID=35708 RepID=A0A0A9HQE6_ARUDO